MQTATTNSPPSGKVHWALFNPKTYATILYFLLSLPLGIVYVTLMITGIALSLALSPIFIGIPLFFGVAKLLAGIVSFEQDMIRHILGLPQPPDLTAKNQPHESQKWFKRMVSSFDAQLFIRNVLLIFLKGIMGIVFFSIMVVCLAIGLALIALPVVHIILQKEFQLDILENGFFQYFNIDWTLNQQYMFYVGAGLILFWLALRIVNGLMSVNRRMMYVDEAYLQQHAGITVQEESLYLSTLPSQTSRPATSLQHKYSELSI